MKPVVSPWFARAEGGIAWVRLGKLRAQRGSVRAAFGYEFVRDKLRIGPAVGVDVMPLAYEHEGDGVVLLAEVSGRGVASMAVLPRLSLRAELGIGVLFAGGQENGVPLRSDRSGGSTVLATLGGALGIDVAIAGPLSLGVATLLRATPTAGAWDSRLVVIGVNAGAVMRW